MQMDSVDKVLVIASDYFMSIQIFLYWQPCLMYKDEECYTSNAEITALSRIEPELIQLIFGLRMGFESNEINENNSIIS